MRLGDRQQDRRKVGHVQPPGRHPLYRGQPSPGVHRGVGGIFYDHLENSSDALFEQNFGLTRDVGEAFLDIFPKLVRRRMNMEYTPEQKQAQRRWRGLYAEFNLVYDRGTTFGLKTGTP